MQWRLQCGQQMTHEAAGGIGEHLTACLPSVCSAPSSSSPLYCAAVCIFCTGQFAVLAVCNVPSPVKVKCGGVWQCGNTASV